MSISIGSTWTQISSGNQTSITVTLGTVSLGDVLIACITKDDDVATTGPSGWALEQGFESNNNIYTEIWSIEVVDIGMADPQWSGDNEEWCASVTQLIDADVASIAMAAAAVGTNATPVPNLVTATLSNAIFISGFGVDGDSTPFTPSTNLTQLSSLQSSVGAGSAGQYVGYKTYLQPLAEASYTGNTYTVTETSRLDAMVWKPDGTKFYINAGFDNKIFEYGVATAWDLGSTITYNGVGTHTATNVSLGGVAFNDAGDRFFVYGTAETVEEFTLATAWDITSTITATGNTYTNTETGATDGREVAFNNDGTRFYLSSSSAYVHEFSLSTPYDLGSTVTFIDSHQFFRGGQGFAWGDNGKMIYEVADKSAGNELIISSHSVSVPYDISTVNEEHGHVSDPTDVDQGGTDATWKLDGTRFYFVETALDTIKEFDVVGEQWQFPETLRETTSTIDSADQWTAFSLAISEKPEETIFDLTLSGVAPGGV